MEAFWLELVVHHLVSHVGFFLLDSLETFFSKVNLVQTFHDVLGDAALLVDTSHLVFLDEE
jgi:hypothetical protein